jgi:hypothetical protein
MARDAERSMGLAAMPTSDRHRRRPHQSFLHLRTHRHLLVRLLGIAGLDP